MAYKAVEIANEFLRLPEAVKSITQMKLQKLTYMAHGWNWAINGEPLVGDSVEAWTYGPVYRDLYDHTKSFGKAPITRPLTPDDENPFLAYARELGSVKSQEYRARVLPGEAEIISQVWKRYGGLNGVMLSELTHQTGTPWYQTYTEYGANSVIPDNLIKAHYEQIADRVAP